MLEFNNEITLRARNMCMNMITAWTLKKSQFQQCENVLMEFVFHRFSPHRAIPHVSIVFFHIKTRIYSSFNTLIIIVINIGALKSTNIVIKLAKCLMMQSAYVAHRKLSNIYASLRCNFAPVAYPHNCWT